MQNRIFESPTTGVRHYSEDGKSTICKKQITDEWEEYAEGVLVDCTNCAGTQKGWQRDHYEKMGRGRKKRGTL